MNDKLDLLLINPGNQARSYGKLASSLSGVEPPIWCGLIASFIREKGFSVGIIDADAENLEPKIVAEKIIKLNPRLTAIIVLGTNPSASSTPKMMAVKETLIELDKISPNLKTLVAGLHPSALPEETLKEEKVDFVCQGEPFYPILQLLEILKSNKEPTDSKINGLWFGKDGKVITSPYPCVIKDLDELPFVAWDLLPMDKYRAHNWHCFENIDERKPYAVIYTSLGCPFNCGYCPIHSFYGYLGIRYRSPEKVVEEINILVKDYRVKNIKIMDELFVLKEDRVNKFCDLIIERGYKLNFWVYARVDTVNKNILKKMKQAGINWIAYGFESANETVRSGVGKKTDQKKIESAIEMTRQAGIYIIGNFIFGLPDDNLETMKETLEMAKKFNFEYVNFYVCMAYPGSKLYNEIKEKNIRLPETWDGFGQYAEDTLPIPTKYLSGEDVLRFRDSAFVEYFSNPDYLNVINKKFGSKVVKHIEGMLKNKISRRFVK